MLRYKMIEIRLSELQTLQLSIPTWELPVLAAVHAGAEITDRGEEMIEREPPEAGDEYRRLAIRYRNSRTEDGGIGPPFVAIVYGQFGVGTQKLADAIKAATVEVKNVPVTDDLIGGVEQASSVGG
jgi:hypothetical protein